ncbi:hypothetical protein OG216_25110 [Streptomycetaceae bacterium NBC_01309]
MTIGGASVRGGLRRPTVGTSDGEIQVRCPYCLDLVRFASLDDLYGRNAQNEYERVDLSHITEGVKYHERLQGTFVRCPNPTGDEARVHYLPTKYLIHEPPLVVALVGAGLAGKSHLLAAMIGEIERNGLVDYGITCTAVDTAWHQRYSQEMVVPLQRGESLERTNQSNGELIAFADALLMHYGGGRSRPVAFFDVSGEELARGGREVQFLAAADAFLYVVDPVTAVDLPILHDLALHAAADGAHGLDRTYAVVLDRLERAGAYLPQPAAVVVTKSDLIRFETPVDAWLAAGTTPPDRLDPARSEAEAADVYAFLHAHGARPWLRPFEEHRRCTGHFVSATGMAERNGEFPGGIRPRRVLDPLVSLLAMCKLLEVPGADLIGV